MIQSLVTNHRSSEIDHSPRYAGMKKSGYKISWSANLLTVELEVSPISWYPHILNSWHLYLDTRIYWSTVTNHLSPIMLQYSTVFFHCVSQCLQVVLTRLLTWHGQLTNDTWANGIGLLTVISWESIKNTSIKTIPEFKLQCLYITANLLSSLLILLQNE